jgi:hypothetical protein
VDCGCTDETPCVEGERSCYWVPDDELPVGVEGPLCSACLKRRRPQ